MAIKFNYWLCAVFLVISLASCATSDPPDDFAYDYSSAEPSDFNGYWHGRVDCSYANGFTPLTWVRIKDGKGVFGFGKGAVAFGHSLGSIDADFDSNNGKVSWRGKLDPWSAGKKRRVSFKGQWRDKTFKVIGTIDNQVCSGVMGKD